MRVWITGASSGIGEACAYKYASMGAKLILTSTSEERLAPVGVRCKEMGAEEISLLPYDLSDLGGIEELSEKAWQCYAGLDLVFLNAGISQRTTVEESSMEMIRKIMEINYFAPVAITKSILPLMIARGGGKIAVTTSIAGRFGFPLRCAYSSSKHALYGFFETLQAEYYNSNIRVTIVCPGRVNTNISFNALDKGGEKHGKLDAGQAGGISCEAAAHVIVKAISQGKREVLVGKKELIMVYIKRFFPALCARLSRNIEAM